MTSGSLLTTSATQLNQFNDPLGQVIARGGFAAENEGARNHISRRVSLMRWYKEMICSTLRCWRLYSWMRLTRMSNIDRDPPQSRFAFRQAGQAMFVFTLDAPPVGLKIRVIRVGLKLAECIQIGGPAVAGVRLISRQGPDCSGS